MSDRVNLKSDVPAKLAFVQTLLAQGFTGVRVTSRPADITAHKEGQTFYFEVKYTGQAERYFGAATLTEWKAALEHEENYRFVIESKRVEEWIFREYTPSEFMEFSYIPPFKVFFNVLMSNTEVRRSNFVSRRVAMTRDRLAAMVSLFEKFRPGS
jgi:hypothetical protein